MERGVIYTAITGGKDKLIDPAHVIPGVSYICFTDDLASTSRVWDIRPVRWTDPDPVRMARRVKLLPHKYLPDFDWSLWVDGNVAITGDLSPMIAQHLQAGSFFAFRHFKRRCAYEEADACARQGKDDPEVMRLQHLRYRKAGMPTGLAMATTLILLRRHNEPRMVQVMEEWWRELARGSRRDQISLPYVLWRTQAPWGFFYDGAEPNWNRRPEFKRLQHAIAQTPVLAR